MVMFHLLLLRLVYFGFGEFVLKLTKGCLCYQKDIVVCKIVMTKTLLF